MPWIMYVVRTNRTLVGVSVFEPKPLLTPLALPLDAQMSGWTPLHVAVVREQLPCMKILLRAGADPRIKDSYSDTVVDILHAVRGKKRAKFLQTLHQFQLE